jgi:lysozyme family protein
MVFAYGVYHKDESSKEKAIKWLEKIKGEKNYIIKGFGNIGVKSITAFDSQALLELKNEYCTNKRCLTCAVGNYLLKC